MKVSVDRIVELVEQIFAVTLTRMLVYSRPNQFAKDCLRQVLHAQQHLVRCVDEVYTDLAEWESHLVKYEHENDSPCYQAHAETLQRRAQLHEMLEKLATLRDACSGYLGQPTGSN
jgi:hypothetical protein